MTQCETCGNTDVDLIWSNGARYPQTRIEQYECSDCGSDYETVLGAHSATQEGFQQ